MAKKVSPDQYSPAVQLQKLQQVFTWSQAELGSAACVTSHQKCSWSLSLHFKLTEASTLPRVQASAVSTQSSQIGSHTAVGRGHGLNCCSAGPGGPACPRERFGK